MSMQAGQIVSPALRLARPIGHGAMGSVWVADHLALNTQVAVKFMFARFAEDPVSVARFKREASAAAQIKSPHVVQILDHGITPGLDPFIVMELLEGEDLASRIERAGPLSLAEAALVMRQACQALGKAHRLGIVHRDIKPSNLFLVDVGGDIFIKVLDFGIAKEQGSDLRLTSSLHAMGTPLYMSPEQFLSVKSVDFRADLWSLAVAAYVCLTGVSPFTGETPGAVYVAIARGGFTPVSRLRPGVPPAIDAWFERALSREPEGRFGSAHEMAEAFERAATGGSEPDADKGSPGGAPPPRPSAPYVEARPPTLQGTSAAVPGRSRRRSTPAASALMLAVIAIIGGAAVLQQVRAQRPAGPPMALDAIESVIAPIELAIAQAALPLAGRGGAASGELASATEESAAADVSPINAPLPPTATPAAGDRIPQRSPAPVRKGRDRGF